MRFLPLVAALPWLVAPLVTLLRARRSRRISEEPVTPPADAPLVSIVIPARNEARNIERCVRSALSAHYPRLEVIVVDDHSTDDTGVIARRIAGEDSRLRVVRTAGLPDGWFGKQWACATGAAESRGEIIGFLDADTWQTPDLLPRIVNGMRSRRAAMFTVAGSQELGSFWERILQPQVFTILLARYGGTEQVNESRHAAHKIANGQCLFVERAAYDAIGGHASVRDRVAEDLALAQRFFTSGHRTAIVLGLEQLSTRMYTSLRELLDGWGKNIYAGGRDSMPFGVVGAAIFPALLVLPSLVSLAPPITLALALAGIAGAGWLPWAAVATSATVLWWLAVYRWQRLPLWYAVLYPLGAAAFLYIAVRAIARGRRVEWKGRAYRSA